MFHSSAGQEQDDEAEGQGRQHGALSRGYEGRGVTRAGRGARSLGSMMRGGAAGAAPNTSLACGPGEGIAPPPAGGNWTTPRGSPPSGLPAPPVGFPAPPPVYGPPSPYHGSSATGQ